MKVFKYFQSFYRLAPKEKALLAEAVFFLFLAKVMLLLLPFRFCIKTLTSHYNKTQPPGEKLISVKLAIFRANRLAFWKNVCLVQAIAARWMLQRRKIGSSLSIGIKQDPKKIMLAHAWLKVGNHEIVSGANDYLPLINY